MPNISELPAMPTPAVYKRANGDLYLKLNEKWQVKAKLDDGKWKGDGVTEQIDPDEVVQVIQEGKRAAKP